MGKRKVIKKTINCLRLFFFLFFYLWMKFLKILIGFKHLCFHVVLPCDLQKENRLSLCFQLLFLMFWRSWVGLEFLSHCSLAILVCKFMWWYKQLHTSLIIVECLCDEYFISITLCCGNIVCLNMYC